MFVLGFCCVMLKPNMGFEAPRPLLGFFKCHSPDLLLSGMRVGGTSLESDNNSDN